MHALREPVGAFAIHLALLDDEQVSDSEREHLAAMLRSVERMTAALTDITKAFGLEVSTPLSLVSSATVLGAERRSRSVRSARGT